MKSLLGTSFSRRLTPFFAVLITASLHCPSGDLRAADWPQWRGPERTGISTETGWNVAWPAEGLKPLWTLNLGPGCSSFSVVGSRAFTMGNDKDTGFVYCLDTETGKTVWKHEFPSPLDPIMFDGGQCSTPTVEGGRVYALGRQGQFFCLDEKTGKVIWAKDFPKDFGAPVPKWGYSSSPLIVGNAVIVDAGGAGASAAAFDKTTGKPLWKAGDDAVSYGSPYYFKHEGKECVAFFNAFGLVVRALADGKELFRFPWKTSYDINPTTPIVADGKIFIASGYNHGAALLELKLGVADPKPLWESKAMRNKMNSCVLWKGFLYGFDEKDFVCMDFATGAVKWKNSSLGMGSLILVDGKLLLQADNGELALAEPSPEAYKELARTPALPKNTAWVNPVLANGKIFCRNNKGEAVCLDVSKK